MSDQLTQHRILNCATELFVQQGFQKTTVREICRAAEANGAAVNYHFGDKSGLYKAVIEYAIQQKVESQDSPNSSPAARLRAWISHFVFSCLGQNSDLLSQLMAHEMTKPTEFLALIVERVIAPKFAVLQEIVEEAAGSELSAQRLQLLTVSIVSQSLVYDHCRPVIEIMMPEFAEHTPEKLEQLVDHITRSSLAMIKAFGDSPDV